MAVLREFKCAQHGDFEGTHPICPAMGCISEHVERVFRTPVSISKGRYKRFDAGLRRTSERMDISNFHTAREGETAFSGRAPIGQELLWGSDVQRVMGRSFPEQMAAAAAPLTVPTAKPDDPYLTVNNGMRATATEMGITQGRIPKAEVTLDRKDAGKLAPAQVPV